MEDTEGRSMSHLWGRFLTHEAICAERYGAIQASHTTMAKRLDEVEGSIKESNGLVIKTLLGIAAALISTLAIIFWTLLIRIH